MDRFWYSLIVFLLTVGPACLFFGGVTAFDDDKNLFLNNFVNHEFLNTIGFMMTVIVASLIQISLSLNTIEERVKKTIFSATRKLLRYHLFTVVSLFILGVMIVLFKPIAGDYKGLINVYCISIVIVYALCILDVALTALSIPSVIRKNG